MSDRSQINKGAVLPLVAVCMVVLVGIVALAIDIGHLLVVRNELQNAADAGALAGAQALYEDPDGTGIMEPGDQVNINANQVANDAAVSNLSEKIAVEVKNATDNDADVQRGHWNMSTHTFTPSDETATFNLFGISEDDLDKMDGNFEYPPGSGNKPVLINAVKVVTRREQTPAASFFAGFLGFQNFKLNADAIGYVGYAGGEIEVSGAPLVICEQSLLDNNGDPTCNIGRMINSGNDDSNNNTAGWSNFDQDFETCSGTNSNEMKTIAGTCGASTNQVGAGPIAATGGAEVSVYKVLYDCWLEPDGSAPTEPWTMTLPVVDCQGSNIGNCPPVTGAVAVNLLWMTKSEGNLVSDEVPTQMGPDWDYSDVNQCGVFKSQVGQTTVDALLYFSTYYDSDYPDGLAGFSDPERWPSSWSTYDVGMSRWDCFVDHFKMVNTDGGYAPVAIRSIYFAPDCDEVHPPTGSTGGTNFGVMAQRPVLVK